MSYLDAVLRPRFSGLAAIPANAGTVAMTVGAWTVVSVMLEAVSDPAGIWDDINKGWLPTLDGLYQVNVVLAGTNTGQFNCAIAVDGVRTYNLSGNAADAFAVAGGAVIPLNGKQLVQAVYFINAARAWWPEAGATTLSIAGPL